MNNLVERLRRVSDFGGTHLDGLWSEAADRIEELEAALKYYAEDHEYPSDGPWGIHSDDFGQVARAALKGETP